MLNLKSKLGETQSIIERNEAQFRQKLDEQIKLNEEKIKHFLSELENRKNQELDKLTVELINVKNDYERVKLDLE